MNRAMDRRDLLMKLREGQGVEAAVQRIKALEAEAWHTRRVADYEADTLRMHLHTLYEPAYAIAPLLARTLDQIAMWFCDDEAERQANPDHHGKRFILTRQWSIKAAPRFWGNADAEVGWVSVSYTPPYLAIQQRKLPWQDEESDLLVQQMVRSRFVVTSEWHGGSGGSAGPCFNTKHGLTKRGTPIWRIT